MWALVLLSFLNSALVIFNLELNSQLLLLWWDIRSLRHVNLEQRSQGKLAQYRVLEDLDIKRLGLSFEDLLDGGHEKCNFLSLEVQ